MQGKEDDRGEILVKERICSALDYVFERMRAEAEGNFGNLKEDAQKKYLDSLTEKAWGCLCEEISFSPAKIKTYRNELEEEIERIYLPFMKGESGSWLKERRRRRKNRILALWYLFGKEYKTKKF